MSHVDVLSHFPGQSAHFASSPQHSEADLQPPSAFFEPLQQEQEAAADIAARTAIYVNIFFMILNVNMQI